MQRHQNSGYFVTVFFFFSPLPLQQLCWWDPLKCGSHRDLDRLPEDRDEAGRQGVVAQAGRELSHLHRRPQVSLLTYTFEELTYFF